MLRLSRWRGRGGAPPRAWRQVQYLAGGRSGRCGCRSEHWFGRWRWGTACGGAQPLECGVRCPWCGIKTGNRWRNVLQRIWDEKCVENKPKVEAKFLKKLCASQPLVSSLNKDAHFAALAMCNTQRVVDDASVDAGAKNLCPEHLCKRFYLRFRPLNEACKICSLLWA